MAKVWKYVLIAALVLLAFGILLGGAGLLTGASPQRTWEALEMSSRIDAALQVLRQFGI